MTAGNDSALFDTRRDMLLRERQTILARIENIERDSHSLELDTDGVPPTGFEREQALTAMLDSRLADIDNALSRLDLGTYGICASCASEIPPRRLQALPFATLCVQCQSEADKRVRRRV